MTTETHPRTAYRHPGIPAPRHAPTTEQVLAAVRSGVATPDDARADFLGISRSTDAAALATGRWIAAGRMEVRLS